uniref:Chromosome 11 open reading frame 97 n=1 Tax=Anser brachyrhynchus TaxID=132585 RepID=A0A8B9D3C1_9AVES
MRAASGEQPAEEAEETGSDGRGEAARGGQPWKKFVYVEPSRRVKEILQEELYFQKEEYHIKHPAAVALEGIWSLKKNFSIGGLKPASQNRNGLLLQPQFYSRHAGMKTTVELTAVSTEWFNHGSPICVYCTEKSVWSLGHRATAWAG